MADVGYEARLEALAQTVLERLQVLRGRSELTTICRPPSCRALKVWKNSSSVRLALEELDVVHQQHVDVAEARLEVLRAPAASASELVRERLAGGEAHGQLGVVRESRSAIAAQQVGLADAREGRT